MDFAKKFMEKYGWKEGEGIGKNKTGIEKPLKANLKFDNAGLGHDQAKDFNNHWWERVFNDAAQNIQITGVENEVVVSTKDEDSVEISTKEFSVKKLGRSEDGSAYKNFLKSSTLTKFGREITNPNHVDIEAVKLPSYKVLTDEELFAACGGRTAHKGARHGLKLSGKLARIAEQEKELLAKMDNNKTNKEIDEWKIVKNKRKNKMTIKDDPENNVADPLLYESEYIINSIKKKKQKNKLESDLSSCMESFSVNGNNKDCVTSTLNRNSIIINKKKKRRKLLDIGTPIDSDVEINENLCSEKKSFELHFESESDSSKTKKRQNKCFPKRKDHKLKNSSYPKKLSEFETSHASKNKCKIRKSCAYKKEAKKLKKRLKTVTENFESTIKIDCDNN